MKIFIAFLMTGMISSAETALPLKIHIVQKCFLGSASPLGKGDEQNVYQITIENEKLFLGGDSVKQIALIADRKRYLIKNNEAHPSGYREGGRKYAGNYRLYGEDLESILDAEKVIAVVLYKKIVRDEYEKNPLSVYDNKVQTTIIKKSYYPVVIDRENAQTEFVACTSTIKAQKERKLQLETVILAFIGGIFVTVLWVMWRRKKRRTDT